MIKSIHNNWYNIDQIEIKREFGTHVSIVKYLNTCFGQRFLDYLGLVCFSSMDL